MFKPVVALSSVFILVAGCGGDDKSAIADSPLVEALSTQILAEGPSGVNSENEATCIAASMVSGIGEERLLSLGMSTDEVGEIGDYNFTDEETAIVIDSLIGCVDVAAALAEEMTSQYEGQGSDCVAENLDDTFIREIMTLGLKDPGAEMPDNLYQTLLDIWAECDLPLN